MKKNLFLISLFLFASVNLFAYDKNFFEISPQIRYNYTPTSDFDNHLSNGIAISFLPQATEGIIDSFDFEYHYSTVDFCKTGCEIQNNQLNQYIFNIEHFFRTQSEKLIPFALAGIGFFDYKYVNSKVEDKKLFNYGAGLRYRIDNQVAIETTLRHTFLFEDKYDSEQELSLTFGVVFGFMPKDIQFIDNDKDGVEDSQDECLNTALGVKVDSVGCKLPEDSDLDGVIDLYDQCPNTEQNTKVDPIGCPFDTDNDGIIDSNDQCPNTIHGADIDEFGCALDSDGDSIPDFIDQCPNSNLEYKISENGCYLDSDFDGINDELDRCPNTPKKYKVTSDGCPSSIDLNVKFQSSKSIIDDKYVSVLNNFAKFMKDNEIYTAEIQGYTDSTGSDIYNLTMSQDRAKAVYNYLIKVGIDSTRLSYKGYGESNFIVTNETPEGREKNRRVEAKLFKNIK